MSVECSDSSVAYRRVKAWAWVAMTLYPVGLIVLAGALLFYERDAIVNGPPTQLSRALSFLHAEFEPFFFWWILPEMLRTLTLVGLVLLMENGTIRQITIGALVSVLYLGLQEHARPYRTPLDNLVALFCSFSLCVVFICAIIIKLASLTQLQELQDVLSHELKVDFQPHPLFTTACLLVTCAGTLALATVVFFIQGMQDQWRAATQRRLRTLRSGEPIGIGSGIALVGKHDFHLFLSHSCAPPSITLARATSHLPQSGQMQSPQPLCRLLVARIRVLGAGSDARDQDKAMRDDPASSSVSRRLRPNGPNAGRECQCWLACC